MNVMTENLSEIGEELRTQMDSLHEAREKALAEGRKIIQLSSKAIKKIHRREFEDAERLISGIRTLVSEILQQLSAFPPIRYAAFLQDSIKEYVEAATLYSIITSKPLPSYKELGVEPQAFLNGICEAASECRRFALDELRAGNQKNAKDLADTMEDIYDELVTFDYPDSLTSGLRRSVDALRAVLERTQSDLAVTGMQLELIQELRNKK